MTNSLEPLLKVPLRVRWGRGMWVLAFVTLIGALLRFFKLNSERWLDEVVALVTYFVAELREVEKDAQKVWVIFSFTRDMRLRFPEVFDYIEANYNRVS